MPIATQFRGVEQTTDTRGILRDAGGTDPVARWGGVSAPAVSNDAKRPANTSGRQLHLIQCLFTVSKTLWRFPQLHSPTSSPYAPVGVTRGQIGTPNNDVRQLGARDRSTVRSPVRAVLSAQPLIGTAL